MTTYTVHAYDESQDLFLLHSATGDCIALPGADLPALGLMGEPDELIGQSVTI